MIRAALNVAKVAVLGAVALKASQWTTETLDRLKKKHDAK